MADVLIEISQNLPVILFVLGDHIEQVSDEE